MKTPRFYHAILATTLLGVFAVGLFLGGIYASTRAVQADNKASLVYFGGIHDALARKDYALADTLTNAAVDSHIGVLRLSLSAPWSVQAFYVFPWTQRQESAITGESLPAVRRAYATQPTQLQADTRDFLAAQR